MLYYILHWLYIHHKNNAFCGHEYFFQVCRHLFVAFWSSTQQWVYRGKNRNIEDQKAYISANKL